MSAKLSGPLVPIPSFPQPGRRAAGERVTNGRILRLVKGGPERLALDSGEVDAVLDRATGTAFLLPEARRAMSLAGRQIKNSLLAALPREDYQSLLGELELVTLTAGEVLYEAGDRIRHVYFPNDGRVSLLTVLVVGQKALEVSLVGREGMVGIPLALGADVSCVRALVQGSGSALRMKAASFREALERCLPLQHELRRYAYTKLIQARQAAACVRFHNTESRVAHCLMMHRERARSDQLHLTHIHLAAILGIRRVGATIAAGALQRRKLISYRRGNIRILDHKGLAAAACECYEIVRKLIS